MANRVSFVSFLILVLALSWGGGAARAGERRLVTEGRINGRPARLVLDTGVSFPLAMPKRAMPKFSLAIDGGRSVDASAAHVIKGFSKPVRIELAPAYVAEDAVFAILEDGAETIDWDFDALIGWPGMDNNQLHYSRRKGIVLLGQHIQLEMQGWATFPMLDSNILVFDAGDKDRPLPVSIDTGWSGGIQLSPELWKAWRAQNGDRVHTFVSFFSPASGFAVREQVFARRIQIGKATFSNVLVSEAPPDEASGSIPPAATLGLAAFANRELLIDGVSRRVHVAPADAAEVLPDYNRLGATFMPRAMTAKVAPGSPAAAAGVKDGDMLVAIDGLTPMDYAANLVTQSAWEQPEGTVVELTLDRAGQRITRRVVLQNFLDPVPG